MTSLQPTKLLAGACQIDITPSKPAFLFGYPHTPRTSTGAHDPLFSSALYLDNGQEQLLFVANDIIWVPRHICQHARQTISKRTGVPVRGILISASHTHSGPVTTRMISNQADPIVPDPDLAYLEQLEEAIVLAATTAHQRATFAKIGIGLADSTCVGTNRRDPDGVRIAQLPTVSVIDITTQKIMALMLVCSMHPTVLHEDSTLVSSDFPGMTRQYLQQKVVGENCPIIYHMGASGNQSPRHITKANTFEEATRLGVMLGKSIEQTLSTLTYETDVVLSSCNQETSLPLRQMPTPSDAQQYFDKAITHFKNLRETQAPRTETRTAECDVFGAEETLALAKAAADGSLQKVAQTHLPAEIQLLKIGTWYFVGWPGEVFVEFAIDVMAQREHVSVITLVNGDMQGYLVTQQAVHEGGYEASNAIFQSPESGHILVAMSKKMLANPSLTSIVR